MGLVVMEGQALEKVSPEARQQVLIPGIVIPGIAVYSEDLSPEQLRRFAENVLSLWEAAAMTAGAAYGVEVMVDFPTGIGQSGSQQ